MTLQVCATNCQEINNPYFISCYTKKKKKKGEKIVTKILANLTLQGRGARHDKSVLIPEREQLNIRKYH